MIEYDILMKTLVAIVIGKSLHKVEGPVFIVHIDEGGGVHKPEEECLQSLMVIPEPWGLNVRLLGEGFVLR